MKLLRFGGHQLKELLKNLKDENNQEKKITNSLGSGGVPKAYKAA